MPKINKLSLVYISLTVLISLTLCPAALARTSTSTELDVAGWALKGGVFFIFKQFTASNQIFGYLESQGKDQNGTDKGGGIFDRSSNRTAPD